MTEATESIRYQYYPYGIDKNVSYLNEKLKNVQDEQGFLGSIWNEFKEATTLGLSQSDCESKLEDYKNGKITFEEAVNYIESYENKQENMKGLFSNILTGIGAIAFATVTTGGTAIPWALAIAKGAPVGALLKTGINLFDRATNKVENDEFNIKTMAKDAISGAMTGATSAVSSGIAKGIKSGKIAQSIFNGAKCGAICGGASGALSYLTDVVFEDDVDFDIDDLIDNSLTSSFVSGSVGGLVGAGLYTGASVAGNIGKETTKTLSQTIVADSASSTTRKIMAQAEKNVLAMNA